MRAPEGSAKISTLVLGAMLKVDESDVMVFDFYRLFYPLVVFFFCFLLYISFCFLFLLLACLVSSFLVVNNVSGEQHETVEIASNIQGPYGMAVRYPSHLRH